MKFSEQWLREWVDPAISTAELVEQMTMAGLEVDGVDTVAADFHGVIVAHVTHVEPHDNADNLNVCKVFNGNEELQVICGAPNVRAGLKVALAEIGAVLPDNFKIKKAKIRGIESKGMLCAKAELGMEQSSNDIIELPSDAPVGTSIRSYLKLDDNSLDVDLTPNRGDCLGIAGLAREVGVLNKVPVTELKLQPVKTLIDDVLHVFIEATKQCPRYLGRIIRNINVTKQTPLWMQEKLRRSDIRSINPVVDVTNYVLLELGQPMHAFDLDKLAGGIKVRLSNPDETIALLDKQLLTLKENTLLITDESGPIAIAGIMGGASTGVDNDTVNIFLESAYFDAKSIAGKARSHAIQTDSSHRYERGVDFKLQNIAIERATQLLIGITGGQAGPITEHTSETQLPKAANIKLRKARIQQILGLKLANQEVEDILSRLGMRINILEDSTGWDIQIPSWRFDLSIEADLIEELARIYGYNKLPVRVPKTEMQLKASPESIVPLANIRNTLCAKGYYEVITYSFVDPALQNLLSNSANALSLANPISSEMSQMRTSMWPGLIESLQYNQNRQHNRIRLFETGQVFLQEANELKQVQHIGLILYGDREPEQWNNNQSTVDYYDLKGDLEAIFELNGCSDQFAFKPCINKHQALHPGQNADIIRNNKVIGKIGALHPELEQSLGLKGPVYLAELELPALQNGKLAKFEESSKFPEVRRDLAIIVDVSVAWSTIDEIVRNNAGELLADLRLFDVYQGEGIDSNCKSIAMGLTWQHRSRTLTDTEITDIVTKVVEQLNNHINASLRN